MHSFFFQSLSSHKKPTSISFQCNRKTFETFIDIACLMMLNVHRSKEPPDKKAAILMMLLILAKVNQWPEHSAALTNAGHPATATAASVATARRM